MKSILKTVALTAAVLGLSLPALADENWLENGDFADGITHWRGNGRSPADFASDNPFDKPDPFTSKGLIIPLRGGVWDKVQQDFRGHGASGTLTITYMVSPGLTFSSKPEDYMDVPQQMHYDGWQAFKIPMGNWIVFIADFGSAHGTYYEIQPKLDATGPQTIRLPVRHLTPMEDKTITLGFPPGDGKLVILNVSLTGGNGGN